MKAEPFQITLRDVAEEVTEFEKENVSLRKQNASLRQKTDKYSETNVVLKVWGLLENLWEVRDTWKYYEIKEAKNIDVAKGN